MLSPASILPPLHLLTYGALLGTQVFQSFIVVKIAHSSLPRAQFITLQKKLFPAYFRTQTALVLATALTFPRNSIASLVRSSYDALPLGIAFTTALLNLAVWGPKTQKAMMERSHQETKYGRNSEDPVESAAMDERNRQFKKAHAMSIHFNAITMLASVWYGALLAQKLEI